MPINGDAPESGRAATAEQVRKDKEELAYLRQKSSSLMMRGDYRGCFKLIEDNIWQLYHKERWPESFLAVLKNHRRCFASMNISQGYDEYAAALLKKNSIPTIFVQFLRSPENSILWTADYFRDTAMALHTRGDREAALQYCEILIKMDPLNSAGILLKGMVLEELGQHKSAMACYEQAVELNPKNYQAWNNLARYYAKKDPQKALEYVDRALELSPGDADFTATRARILLESGNKAGAMECLEQAVQINPLSAELPYQLGELLMEDGQTLSAMRQFSRAVEIDGGHLPAQRKLVSLLADTQPEQALLSLNTICTMDPEDIESGLLRARLLQKLGNPRLAARQYHTILNLHDNIAEAWGGLGDLHLSDEAERALGYFDKAVGLNDKVARFRLGRGKAHEKLGNIPEALEEYEATVVLDKQIAEAWGSLGILQMSEKPDLALECLNRALGLAPENPYYHHAKGEALIQTGHPGAAMESLNIAVKLDPGNAIIHMELGQLLENMGNRASALEHYRQAVSLDRDCAGAYAGLARLLRHTEPENAIAHATTAIGLDGIKGEYYFIKSKVLEQLDRDPAAMDRVREGLRMRRYPSELATELVEVAGGDCIKIALVYIDRGIELVPRSSTYLCTRADLLYYMKLPAKAMGQYEQSLELDPRNYKALYGMGRILAEKNDKKALEYLDRALAINPNSFRCHAEKAALLAKDPATWRQALESYDKAITAGDRPWQIMLEKARLLDQMGNIISAQEEYRRVLLVNRDCLEATARLGQVLAEHKAMTGLGYLEHALELDPDNGAWHVYRARLLYLQGNREQGREAAQRAVALAGGSADMHLMLAQNLEELSREDALEHAFAACEKDPQRAESQLLRGDLLSALKRHTEARAAYEQVLALQSSNHEALAKISLVLGELEPEKSQEAIDQALKLSPGNPLYLYIKAQLLAVQEGGLPVALQCMNEAVKADPDNPTYNEELVRLLEQSGSTIKLAFARRKLEKSRRREQELRAQLEALEGIPAEESEPPPIEPAQEEPALPEPQFQEPGVVAE